jgi:hypothetical protein
MLSLIRLGNCLGTEMTDGAVHMPALTHHLIAEYVGTSREVVSSQMSRLRKAGLVRYSRKYIDVYPQAMQEALRQQGVHVQTGSVALTPGTSATP